MTRSGTPLISELPSGSVAVNTEKMIIGTDLSPKSTMDHSQSSTPAADTGISSDSPTVSESVQSQLDRRVKECETAKKLIDTMRVNRERDQSLIAELNAKVTALSSECSGSKDEKSKLVEQISFLREEVERAKESNASMQAKLAVFEQKSAKYV